MSVFYVKTVKIVADPWLYPPLPNPGCATACNHAFLPQLFPLRLFRTVKDG